MVYDEEVAFPGGYVGLSAAAEKVYLQLCWGPSWPAAAAAGSTAAERKWQLLPAAEADEAPAAAGEAAGAGGKAAGTAAAVEGEGEAAAADGGEADTASCWRPPPPAAESTCCKLGGRRVRARTISSEFTDNLVVRLLFFLHY